MPGGACTIGVTPEGVDAAGSLQNQLSDKIFLSHQLIGSPAHELDAIPENVQYDAQVERETEIETEILSLIEKTAELRGPPAAGALSPPDSGKDDLEEDRVADLSQIRLENKKELDRAAWHIMSKAIEEPRYCDACAVLARALHLRLPAVPPTRPGKKAETFMYALLDACQTVFEDLLSGLPRDAEERENAEGWETEKMLATVRFAGRLHCQGLLGMRVVGQMVHDLVANHAVLSARELLLSVGVTLDDQEYRNLRVVLEGAVGHGGQF
jgi:hypothetical protein